MRPHCLVLVLCFLSEGVWGQGAASRPAFAGIHVPSGQGACPLTFEATLSPDNGVMSVLRTASTSSAKEFLGTGPGYETRGSTRCTFDARFQRPLGKYETLYIDLRGTEFKERATTVDWTMAIGTQRHRFTYARGRLLDAANDTFGRFAIVLPPGATSVHFVLSGRARADNPKSTAFVSVDALDMCFEDAAHPEHCGGTNTPSNRAPKK
jgi:hypothetical protein